MIDVFKLLISTSLKVLFSEPSVKYEYLDDLIESLSLSNKITVSYNEYPNIVNRAITVEGVISKPSNT